MPNLHRVRALLHTGSLRVERGKQGRLYSKARANHFLAQRVSFRFRKMGLITALYALGPPPLFAFPAASPSPPPQPLGTVGQWETLLAPRPRGSPLPAQSPSSRSQGDANPLSDSLAT